MQRLNKRMVGKMELQLDDFECCPKCTTNISKGLLVEDPCYIENVEQWLYFIKCYNCGWRLEVKGDAA